MISGKDTFERQMSAIVGKLLTDLENMEYLHSLKPLEFDVVRRRCIDAAWESYLVGRKKGLVESHERLDTP